VQVFGELPLGGTDELLDVPVPQPATWFATALKEALRRAEFASMDRGEVRAGPTHLPSGNAP
jgi:hypothetical protein